MKVSRKFKIAVKMSEIPAWQIALQAGINSNVLSKIMSGACQARPGDQRVLRVAKVLGLNPDECFEKPTKEPQHTDPSKLLKIQIEKKIGGKYYVQS